MSAIVFDLDGTLVDSAPDIRTIANTVADEQGLSPVSMAQTRQFIGNGAGRFVERMMAAGGLDPAAPGGAERHARMLERFLALYETVIEDTAPYPGVIAALDELAARGYRLGICTNKPGRATAALLGRLGLAERFDAIITGDTLEMKKPDPAPLDAAFAELGGPALLYVGDSEVDAETAQAAGLRFALFTEGYRKSPLARVPHDYAFSHHDALPVLVSGLRGAA